MIRSWLGFPTFAFTAMIAVSAACQSLTPSPVAPASPITVVAPTETVTEVTTPSSAAPTATPRATPAVAKTPLDIQALTGDRAMAHVRHLATTIESRVTDTDKEREAADYIAAQLKGFGDQVEQQGFEFPWSEDASSLRAGGMKLETGMVVRSAQGDVTADLADTGDGNAGRWQPYGKSGAGRARRT